MNNKLNNNFSMRKLLLTALVAGPLAVLPAPLWALPDVTSTNLTTSSGVTTQVVGTTLNVTAPDKAILTWQAFGSGGSLINANEVINYFLPSATSSVLNSVSGGVASTINGSIISNGNVYVLNPSGIVISATAQVNTGGFYASTVAEPSGFFSINGSLSFAGTSSASITVAGTGTTSGTDAATIQAVGPGNNIYLAGNQVNVNGGKFYGNLFVRSSGSGTNTTFGGTGPVSINQVGVPLVGGGLNVTTNGGNVVLTGAGGLTIAPAVASTTGAVSITTTGNGVNGTITQGAGAFLANTTGTVVTLNAGTGTTASAITLGVATNDFLTIGATGSNIALTDVSGVVLNGSTATGTLAVTTTGAITQGSGTQSVGGTITLSPTAGNTVSFTGTGNLTFANFGANPGTTTINTSGDLTLNTIVASNALSLTSTGGQITAASISTSSTLTISATNAAAGKLTSPIVQGNTSTINVAGDINIATRLQNGGSSTMSVTSSAGSMTLGLVTASSTLNLTATAGSITTGNVQTATLNITAANGSITTGTLSTGNAAVLNSGSVTTGNINSTNTGLTITATTGSITTGTIATNSTLTLSAPSAAGTITTGTITSSTTRVASLTSGGSITLAGGTIPVLSVTSTAGSITQSAAITSTSSATFNALGDIALTTNTNDFTTLVLQGGASASSGFSVVDANSIVVGNATNARAATTIATTANGSITLGNNQFDTIAFGSTLGLTATGTGTINTNSNTVTVFGNVSLTTAGTAATLGRDIFGNSANYQFGQVNATLGAGALNVYENTTLNLGTITAASVDARSFSSDIINTGKITTTGNVTVYANSIFSPGNASLNFGTNAITGAVIISNAKDVTVVNNGNTTVTAGSTANGKAATGTVSVEVKGTNANTLVFNTATGGDYNVVSFTAPGAVTVTDPNAITLQNLVTPAANNATIAVNAAGVITLGSGIALGGSGAANFTSTGGSAGIVDSAPNIRIFGSSSFTSDNSISITNAGHSLGAVSLATTGNNGVNGTANISYTEGGTANLNVVSVNTSANANVPAGNLTVVSTGGNIQQTAATGSIIVPATGTGTNVVSFTSNQGAVTLTNPAGTNNIVPAIGLSAVGNSSVAQSANNVTLGNIGVTGGTLTVDTSAGAARTVAQATGTTIKSFGNAIFNTQGAKITLTNTGNNFGAVTTNSNAVNGTALVPASATSTVAAGAVTAINASVVGTGYAPSSTFAITLTGGGGAGATGTATTNASGVITSYAVTAGGAGYTSAPTVTITPTAAHNGADVAITETGTLNFASVNTGLTGTLAATSENASIIQSGTGGLTVGGNTTLTASAAGITLNTGTTSNNFGGATNKNILVTTVGNVSIQDASTTTILNGNSNIGGALTLKNTNGTGTIKDSPGTLTVSGNVLFDTTTNAGSSVSIGSSTASLGAIQFRSGTVTIVENASLNVAAGSVASGPVSLTSSGNIVTSGSGGGTFQSTLQLNASGSITITNPIFVNGAGGSGLTFRALGAVDLSALSLAGNLNSINPTNLGASSYKAPSP